MNQIERHVYDFVKSNPRLKKALRNVYQRCFDLLPKPSSKSAYPIRQREGFFFGFHDHSPFDPVGTRLLANRFRIPLRMPKAHERLEVGYFTDSDLRDFKPIAETRAWMWHMGCKLQWRGDTGEVVFNDHLDGQNIARVVHPERSTDRVLSDAIGSISGDGRWAVGYSFARVQKCMPGYGYIYDTADPEIDYYAPKNNGVHRIDLDSGKRELLLSLSDLAAWRPELSMEHAHHFVTHAVFSPYTHRFIFLHRWVQLEDIEKRWSRMLSCDIDGNNWHVFPTDGMVSHIGWRDSYHAIAYCRIPEYGDQYVLFEDQNEQRYEIIGHGQFNSDGHPSFDASGRWMVTDTYPDRRRVQRLILYDTQTETRYDIAELPMPKQYQSPSLYEHWTCDLHPRWDRTGTRVCFDSAFTGTRSLCTIDLGRDFGPDTIKYLSKH